MATSIGAGIHDPVTVVGSALGTSKNGSDQIIVTFRNAAGATISAYLSCSERAWPYTAEKLTTLGWDPQKNGYAFEALNADQSPIAGNEVQIVVNEEWYENRAVAKVAFINPCGGGPRERMDPHTAAAFGARLRARLRGQAGAGGARKADEPGPPPDDDHIPF